MRLHGNPTAWYLFLATEYFQRSIDQEPAIHNNRWFESASRILQYVEGGAVLLVHAAMGRTRESLLVVLLPLRLYTFSNPSPNMISLPL